MLCMDTTIFILTLAKTIRVRNHMNHGVQSVLFRDGKDSRIPAESSRLLTCHQVSPTMGMSTSKVR